jgi:outer membrane lipoprotein-sorting protein
MPKLLSSTIFFTTLATIVAIASATIAKSGSPLSNPSPSTLPSAKPALPVNLIADPTSDVKPDLKLLSKAAGIFWQTDRAETISQTRFYGTRDGVKTDVSAQMQTIAQTGNKFRSKLTFIPPGSKVRTTYLIVSNGQDVWIHQLERQIYTKTSLAALKKDRFWIGFSSAFFTGVSEQNRQEFIASLVTNPDFTTTMTPLQLKELQQDNISQINYREAGVNVSRYSFGLKSFRIEVTLRREDTKLQKIELISEDPKVDLTMSETIIKRSSQVNITSQTFTFTPPTGAKKVNSIKIIL